MNNKKIHLWKSQLKSADGKRPSITPFLLEGNKPHPAILIIPGGGYGCVCGDTEGIPTAKKFNSLGFHAFVLDYRVKPDRFPAPQQDAFRAMKIIRGNAEKWQIDPNWVGVCGFSAGGHLAGCLCTIENDIDARANDHFDAINGCPDFAVLVYPVISFEPWSHNSSGKNLFGELTPKHIENYSLEKRVHDKTPPVFLLHTIGDQAVSVQNSIMFAEAMIARNLVCEMHIFPYGRHGMLLGKGTHDFSTWPKLVQKFVKTQYSMRNNPTATLKRYTYEFQKQHS